MKLEIYNFNKAFSFFGDRNNAMREAHQDRVNIMKIACF